jgi:hypothetical protein
MRRSSLLLMIRGSRSGTFSSSIGKPSNGDRPRISSSWTAYFDGDRR